MSAGSPPGERRGRPGPEGGRSEELPTVVGTPAPPSGAPGSAPRPEPAAEAGEEWLSRAHAAGIRLAAPAAALLAVVFVAAGFWGGAAFEKHHLGSVGGSSGPAFAARFRAAGATGGAGGARLGFGAPGAAPGTSGTVSIVAGRTLYILSATGALVKVTLTPSTTITREAGAKPIELRPGDTVTVQGATGPAGTLAASSLVATAPGVSASRGGFGRGVGAAAGGAAANGGTANAGG